MPFLLLLLLFASTPVYALPARCQPIQREIDWVDARMRQPYRRAEGERLRARLRQLKADRALCMQGRS